MPLLVFLTLAAFAWYLPPTATGDSGDSITHYLYSRYAFSHPGIFFDHWAKPLFVLVTALPAQFGFKGMSLFNVACLTTAAVFCYRTAKAVALRMPLFVYAVFLFAPLCVKLCVSGLTEYFFAAMLSAALYFMSVKRRHTAAAIVSLLPFVRSEGLIVFGIFLVIFLVRKRFRSILFLLSGQVLYSIIGAGYYKNVMWIFSEIPYAKLGSPYGHGQLSDMLHRLNYVIEKPILYLLVLSILFLAWRVRRRDGQATPALITLSAAIFIAYFVFHSFAWWQGLFNSMGLPRVMIAVMPCMALLCAWSLECVESLFKKWREAVVWVHVLAVMIYPFTPREKGVVYNDDLFRVSDNEAIDKSLIPYLEQNAPDYRERVLYATHPYVILSFGADPFNYKKFAHLDALAGPAFLPRGALVVWDNAYSEVESGITLDKLERDTRLVPEGFWKQQSGKDEFRLALFVTK